MQKAEKDLTARTNHFARHKFLHSAFFILP